VEERERERQRQREGAAACYFFFVVLLTFTALQASDRTYTSYIAYAKEYSNAISLLRYLRKKVDFSRINVDVQELYHTIGLPLSRMGEYGVIFACLFDDLDDRARKSLVSAIKLLDTLYRKSRAKAMPKIYS
jgi:hypothetical protein